MIRHDDPFYIFNQKLMSDTFDNESHKYEEFSKCIWDFYKTYGRTFMWRHNVNPYVVLVSEIMLQQTQTQRVSIKLPEFLAKFPNFKVLADSTPQELFQAWVGLGYNRRALALRTTAQKIIQDYAGALPNDPEILKTFPGIGPATAASITAFAYNRPTIFIETNIRAVYLHVFFHGQQGITDAQLLPHIQATVDEVNPRDWYYALMDYGVYIKKTYPNPSRASRHHTAQSKFEGSNRQIRGAVIRLLTEADSESAISDLPAQLRAMYGGSLERIELILDQMCQQELIMLTKAGYSFFHETKIKLKNLE